MMDFILAMQHSYHRVNQALEYYLNNFSKQKSLLIRSMRYSTLIGGKRLRPFLVYQTGKLFGLSPANIDAPAAAIECIHAYSLIHDDLPTMDNGNLRRGKPTCHIKFGETTALLAGDALQTLAFSILADADMPGVSIQGRLQMISALASASGANGMCLGQALDLESENKQISTVCMETIHQCKTGALIRAAVRLGAIAAGERSSSILYYLDCYANAIGLAFQVQDDILDLIGNYKITGKKQGVDRKLRKNTYPSLLGLDKARDKITDLYNESIIALKYIAKLGYDINILLALARYVIERNQ